MLTIFAKRTETSDWEWIADVDDGDIVTIETLIDFVTANYDMLRISHTLKPETIIREHNTKH